jgi:hypothetical protein
VCFITAGPITKLFAWGGGRVEDMCYERRRAEATQAETLDENWILFVNGRWRDRLLLKQKTSGYVVSLLNRLTTTEFVANREFCTVRNSAR